MPPTPGASLFFVPLGLVDGVSCSYIVHERPLILASLAHPLASSIGHLTLIHAPRTTILIIQYDTPYPRRVPDSVVGDKQ